MLAAIALLTVPQGIHLAQYPWWHIELLKMKREGLLVGYPNGFHSHRYGPSRYEWAVMTNAAVTNTHNILDGWPQTRRAIARGELDYDLAAERRQLLKVVQPLPYIVHEFRKELGQLGVDVPHYEAKLNRALNSLRTASLPKKGEAFTRFPDVPTKHWADEAVHNLRQEGILWGYSDGTFGLHSADRWWQKDLVAIKREGILLTYDPTKATRHTDALHVQEAYRNAMTITEDLRDREFISYAIKSIAENPPLDTQRHVRGSAGPLMLADLQFYKGFEPFLARIQGLVLEFSTDIEELGTSPESPTEMVASIDHVRALIREIKIPKTRRSQTESSTTNPSLTRAL